MPEPDRIDLALELAKVRRLAEDLTREVDVQREERAALERVVEETHAALQRADKALGEARSGLNAAIGASRGVIARLQARRRG